MNMSVNMEDSDSKVDIPIVVKLIHGWLIHGYSLSLTFLEMKELSKISQIHANMKFNLCNGRLHFKCSFRA